VIRETSQSLAQDVYQQLANQLGYTDAQPSRGVRPPSPWGTRGGGQAQPVPVPQQPEQVLILK
jgi:hypothetical protein